MLDVRIVDLGEYIVKIEYDNETGAIEVTVLDELQEIIESLKITNAEDSDNDEERFDDYDISLN